MRKFKIIENPYSVYLMEMHYSFNRPSEYKIGHAFSVTQRLNEIKRHRQPQKIKVLITRKCKDKEKARALEKNLLDYFRPLCLSKRGEYFKYCPTIPVFFLKLDGVELWT